MSSVRWTFVLFLVINLCLPAWAGGKVSYRTGEGAGIKVTVPFGSSATDRVKNVIDGDTIELEDGRLVRYIGIDTPEVRHKEEDSWVYAPEPFSEEATEANRRLVEGKHVRLEFDQEKTDRFGRLLAYVFVNMNLSESDAYGGSVFLDSHEIFVNAHLIREGYARLLVIPPNQKYAVFLQKVETEARRERRNLWGENHAGQR